MGLGTIVTGLALAFFIMSMWYVTQPIVLSSIDIPQETGFDMGVNNTHVNAGVNILRMIAYWWGPLVVAAIGVVWIVVAAHGRDPSSMEGF